MRATWLGARSGRISITTLPLVVSSVSVSSGFAIVLVPFALALDGRLLHVVQPREARGEVSVTFRLQVHLVGSAPARRALAVTGVELIDDLHAADHLAERGKAHAVEVGIV